MSKQRMGVTFTSMIRTVSLVLLAAACFFSDIPFAVGQSTAVLEEGLEFRCIGPFRGGRSAAVTGVENDPMTFYMGATGGGVWKTTNGGTTWENISDGYFGGSIGAVAVSPSHPNILYVGGGEVTVRGNVSPGTRDTMVSDARGRLAMVINFRSVNHLDGAHCCYQLACYEEFQNSILPSWRDIAAFLPKSQRASQGSRASGWGGQNAAISCHDGRIEF